MRYLTFALTKGRLASKTMDMFEKIGITCEEMRDKDSRKLIFVNEELKVRFFLAKANDIPTYVEYGAADIGIVGKDTILEDFMRSNVYLDGELEYMLRYLESKKMDSLENVQKISAFFKVKEEYLDRVFKTIQSEYGTVDRFLRRGLYLTQKSLEDLREKYLI